MSDATNRLDDEDGTGLTPLDIADLPDEQRQVMLSFLRDAAGIVTLDALRNTHNTMDNLTDVLAALTDLNWLTRLGEEPNVRYKVNLRRRRASRLSSNVWAALSEPDSERDTLHSDPSPDETASHQRRRPSLFDW